MTSLRVLGAFVRRDWTAARSYPTAFVLELLSALLVLTLFFFLSEIVDQSKLTDEGDFERGYFAFVVIGLACFDLVHACVESFATRLRNDQTSGTLEALLITPPRPGAILLGLGSYALLYASVLAMVRVLMAILFFGVDIDAGLLDVGAVLVAVLGTIAFFAAAGIVVAAMGLVIMRPGALVGTAVNALGLIGGVYFPVGVLPGPLETLAQAVPLTWALDVLRAALGGEDVPGLRLIELIAAAAVALPLAVWLFELSVRHARRRGTLALY